MAARMVTPNCVVYGKTPALAFPPSRFCSPKQHSSICGLANDLYHIRLIRIRSKGTTTLCAELGFFAVPVVIATTLPKTPTTGSD